MSETSEDAREEQLLSEHIAAETPEKFDSKLQELVLATKSAVTRVRYIREAKDEAKYRFSGPTILLIT